MKNKLSLQNGQTPLKTAQRTNKLRKNIFKILFKGLEFLWFGYTNSRTPYAVVSLK